MNEEGSIPGRHSFSFGGAVQTLRWWCNSAGALFFASFNQISSYIQFQREKVREMRRVRKRWAILLSGAMRSHACTDRAAAVQEGTHSRNDEPCAAVGLTDLERDQVRRTPQTAVGCGCLPSYRPRVARS